MGLPGLTELALTVLIGRTFLLLMSLPVRKELALTGSLGGTLLIGRTELVLTTLNRRDYKQVQCKAMWRNLLNSN